MIESLEYYNNFDSKLINDYVLGNKRIESAIVNLGAFIPFDSKYILDIGCGLGWSSHEFSKHFINSEVLGIDLSPVLIQKAKKIFSNDNLSYGVFDVTRDLPENKFDAIILIDVYEHIPIKERRKFHYSLKTMINDSGRIILACPSKYHQSWLKDNNPNGLQPIDEDVDLTTVLDIANDVNGEVLSFEYQKIWRNLDYLYSVIEVAPNYHNSNALHSVNRIKLENKESRIRRINEKLNLSFEIQEKNKIRVFKVAKKNIKKILNKIMKTLKITS